MKYLILTIIAIALSGCNEFGDLRTGKAAQICHDNNTSYYQLQTVRSGWRIICINGKEIFITSEELRQVTGSIVEKYTKDEDDTKNTKM